MDNQEPNQPPPSPSSAPSQSLDAKFIKKLVNLWQKKQGEANASKRKIEEIEAQLTEYAKANGMGVLFDKVLAYERVNPATLVPIKESLDEAVCFSTLMAELDGTDYVRKTLNVSEIAKNAQTKTVKAALKTAKLKIITSTPKVYFKSVK